jgi:hypothetical protein
MPADCAEIGEALAGDEETFVTGDAEVDAFCDHPGDERGDVGGRGAGGEGFDGIAAGPCEERVVPGGVVERGDEGVFASAFAGDEDFHGVG